MNGDELRTARLTADLTQQELADKLSVSMRTVGNWERSSTRLPKPRARQIRDILGGVGDDANPLEAASDMALLAELGRRLDRVAQTKEAGTDVSTEAPQKRHEPVLEAATFEDLSVPRPDSVPDPLSGPGRQGRDLSQ